MYCSSYRQTVSNMPQAMQADEQHTRSCYVNNPLYHPFLGCKVQFYLRNSIQQENNHIQLRIPHPA
jgi:hypothetical protein